MDIEALDETSPRGWFDQIARLHESELQAGLLAKLGAGFLAGFYRHVAADRSSLLLAALDHGSIAGFVSGTTDIGTFYRRFMLRRGLWLAWHLVPYFVRRGSPSTLGSFQRYLGSPPGRELPVSELTSLAVAPGAQRKGVGRLLFRAFQQRLREKGIDSFKVSAATTQIAALDFYPALGARRAAAARLGELELVVFVCPTAP